MKSKGLNLGIIVLFLFLFFPVEGLAQVTGSLKGFVYMDNFDTRIEGAVIEIENVINGNKYSSQATDKKGFYEISGIPEGRYLTTVTIEKAKYSLDFQVYIKGNEKAELLIAIEADITGVPPVAAALAKKNKIIPLWLIAGAAGAAGLTTLGAIALTNNENPTSPAVKVK